jgi:glycine/D-amino acid oxidase-like deaminating enzyme/nitrite reductase/ring-hydroxylating ferredoxin subunit
MNSLWQLTAPLIGSDALDRKYFDAVVVGAGLTGLTTAVLLARAGKSVAVLEARRAGDVTTGNTTGKLSLLQGNVLSELRSHAGDEVLQAYAEANREGQAWLAREFEGTSAAPEHRTAFTYAASDDQRESLEREFEASSIAGINLTAVEHLGLPWDTFGALSLENQMQVQPMSVLVSLAQQLRERGGLLIEHCRVHDVEVGDSALSVQSSLGTIRADICVLATGIPILDRAMFFAKVEPSRSFVNAYRLTEAPPQGMYVSLGSPSRSLRTAAGIDGDELLVVGGPSDVVGRNGDTVQRVRELDAWAATHFAGSRRLHSWAAQDYRTHSRIPFAGAMPRGGGRIFTATGYNKWGMTNAVAAALALSSEALGGNMEWAKVLNEGCIRLSGFTDAVGVNAGVAAHAVGGWASAQLRSITRTPAPEEGQGVVVTEGIEPVAISKVDGKICKVSGICTHLGGVLRWNTAERSWDCPLHGSRFTAEGELLEGPAVKDLASHEVSAPESAPHSTRVHDEQST